MKMFTLLVTRSQVNSESEGVGSGQKMMIM